MSARTRTANESLAEEFGTISDLIRAHAVERPAAVALVKDAEPLSYTQLDQLMDRVTAALQQNGLRMGDVIAICAKTSIEILLRIPWCPAGRRSGEPKGIMHSHRMRWMQLRAAAALSAYSSSSVTILSTPLYSNMTLRTTVVPDE